MSPVNAKYLKAPFRPDFKGGYVFNASDFMFAEVRGWGQLQYGPDAEKIQDANLQFMVDSLNEKLARDGLIAPDDPLRTKDLLLINQTRNERIGELELEVEWLRFLKESVCFDSMVDDEALTSIRREYKRLGKTLPKKEQDVLDGI